MKCPLSFRTMYSEKPGVQIFGGNCLKEDCAWWDENAGRCGVLEVPRLLQAIGHTLGQLESKIP